jgi:DNA-binding transcriptional regulator GbsR (MarR family)
MTSVEIADVVEDDPSNVSSKLGRLYKFGLLDRTRPRGQRAFVYTISKEGLSQLDSPEIVTKPKTKKIKKVHTELENQITDLKLTLVDRNKEVEQLTIENKHKDNEINELKSEISDLNDILTRVTGGVTDYLLKYKTDSKNVGKEIIELLLGRRSST